jgi:2-amino-4-hydroxy-6-hydroxymethyldihydropteridine diphosphokinase/dihydropteroate synthase
MIYIALGSNLENRLDNLRLAISALSKFVDIKFMSHVIETEAMLLPNSPRNWDRPFYNIAIACESACDPFDLLSKIKELEKRIGRNLKDPTWSPRIIDMDIIFYENIEINSENLQIPHPGVKNRNFLQYLLREIGCEIPDSIKLNLDEYKPLNNLVLYPKLVGIVNVTPDSFSDGGNYAEVDKAEAQARKLYNDGATLIEFGAQSTRPGYVEISPCEEICRVGEVLERCSDIDCLCIDSYFDEVIKYAIEKHDIKWINDQNSNLRADTLKLIADNNTKLVIMLHGNDICWFERRIKELENFGIVKENILIDPGIGFGKTKHENIKMIRNINKLKEFGCEIYFGHSRKSFITLFSDVEAKCRDIETIAVSDLAANAEVDYLRVHNIKDHMRFFVAKYCMELYF